ncbi:hypothetical protein CEXT_794591 [Caerostris extrusa]|uniref:Uncharacterized protein n=1 Tax=Caerostris extrusa TaxID=172846 RepID=A0AAV4Y0U6_CAEEX|nr:hypothetical protein CEXT_794591 [Caerostris extrusa]
MYKTSSHPFADDCASKIRHIHRIVTKTLTNVLNFLEEGLNLTKNCCQYRKQQSLQLSDATWICYGDGRTNCNKTGKDITEATNHADPGSSPLLPVEAARKLPESFRSPTSPGTKRRAPSSEREVSIKRQRIEPPSAPTHAAFAAPVMRHARHVCTCYETCCSKEIFILSEHIFNCIFPPQNLSTDHFGAKKLYKFPRTEPVKLRYVETPRTNKKIH